MAPRVSASCRLWLLICLQACPAALGADAACGARVLAPGVLEEDASGSSHLIQLQASQLLADAPSKSRRAAEARDPAEHGEQKPPAPSRHRQTTPAPRTESKASQKRSKSGGTQYRLTGKAASKEAAEEMLQNRGRFLGYSHDAWALLIICVGGNLVCILATVVNVSIAVSCRANDYCRGDIPKDDRGYIRKPVFPVGWLQRNVFIADSNPTFAYKAGMAFRTALACAGCALPYYIPSLHWLNELGFSFSYAVVIICFTVYMDIGTTLSLAWYNFAGTLLPTLNCLFCYGIYPEGAQELYSNAWWFGVLNFVLFITLQMVLRWPAGLRMFAVSWQAYFSMCFINPDDTTHFSNGIKNIVLEGAAVGPTVGTVIGMVIAVLCMCTSPAGHCFSALTAAQETALTITWEETRQWRRMIKYYSNKSRSVVIDKLQGEAQEMQAELNKLEGYLGSNSWWECFDLGRAGKVRAHLLSLKEVLLCMNDWLHGTLQALVMEDFGDQHDDLLDIIRDKLLALSDTASELFYLSVRTACKGGVDPAERETMQESIDKVLEAQKDLAAEFIAARVKVYGEDTLTADALSEHFFAFSLSVYGQRVSDFAQSMMNNEIHTPGIGIVGALLEGLRETLTFNTASYAVRSSLGFYLAFAIGLKGISGILSPFNSTPAGTTAYLMASEGKGGSAILKNIARFQGTAGGTLLGKLLFALMISCTARGQVLGICCVILMEFFSMYLYFASASFGYVGVLLGAYGAQHLLLSCDQHEGPEEVYGVMLQQFLAIMSVTIADLLIGNVSSATLAVQAYCKMSDEIGQSIKEFLCLHLDSAEERTDIPLLKTHRKQVLIHYGEALAQGSEAPLEPRWYRTPWRTLLWQKMEKLTNAIGDQMAAVEYASLEGHQGGCARKALVDSASMRDISWVFLQRAQSVFLLCEKLMMHESNAPFDLPKALMEGLLRQTHMSSLMKNPNILKEVNESILESRKKGKEPLTKLTQDDACQVGADLLMFDYMIGHLNKLEDALFTSRELLVGHLK